jgi:DUF4097 and DUF4098 domain-containing protein YvlB
MEQRFETTHPLTADINIPAGTIDVRVHDEPVTTARVTGSRADDISVEFDERPSGDRLTVGTRGRKWLGWLGVGMEVDVTLVVPEGTTLDVTTGSAGVEVTGSVAAITFRSGSGALRFDGVTGNVVTKTASGDVDGGDVRGSVRSNGASGDLSIGSVGRTCVCRSASGDLSIGRAGGDTQLASASGDVEIGVMTAGKTLIRTVSGDAEVGVVEGADVYLDLASTSGAVSCDLEPASGPIAGSAELSLDVTSVSGDVRIRRVAASSGGP